MEANESYPPHKKKVLVVDDDDTQRDFLKLGLTTRNYEVVCASSAEEALRSARATRFDFVLSDIMMPGMNGIELLTELKKIHPDVPVIMSTAQSTLERAMECVKRGAFDYIPKPVSIKDLCEIFERSSYLQGVKVGIGDLEEVVQSIPPFLSKKADELDPYISRLSKEVSRLVKRSYDGFPPDQIKVIRRAEALLRELTKIVENIRNLTQPPQA